jgi:hypothetical protein
MQLRMLIHSKPTSREEVSEMSVRPYPPNQRGTVLLSRATLRKLTTETSTRRFALVVIMLAVTGFAALGVGGWLASVAVLRQIESLLAFSASPTLFGFFLVYVGIIGSLGAFIGGLVAFQSVFCLLWQRVQAHNERAGEKRERTTDESAESDTGTAES